jgi:hypothetical protein
MLSPLSYGGGDCRLLAENRTRPRSRVDATKPRGSRAGYAALGAQPADGDGERGDTRFAARSRMRAAIRTQA